MLAAAKQHRRYGDFVSAVLQSLDGGARRDATQNGDRRDAVAIVAATGGKARRLPRISRDARTVDAMIARVRAQDTGRRIRTGQPERLAAGCRRANALGRVFRQSNDFERSGALLEPADEPAFLQRRDQAVNARFGAQIQRVLHFVERGGHAGFPHPLVDEHQKLVLLLGQHGIPQIWPEIYRGEQSRNANRSTLVLGEGQREHAISRLLDLNFRSKLAPRQRRLDGRPGRPRAAQ